MSIFVRVVKPAYDRDSDGDSGSGITAAKDVDTGFVLHTWQYADEFRVEKDGTLIVQQLPMAIRDKRLKKNPGSRVEIKPTDRFNILYVYASGEWSSAGYMNPEIIKVERATTQ